MAASLAEKLSKLRDRAHLLPEILAVCLGIRALLRIAGGTWERLRYPYSLQWIESVNFAACLRRYEGGSLYSPPSSEWTGVMYGPVFPEICGAAMHVGGPRYLVGRLLALTASFVVVLEVAVMARRARTPWTLAAPAAVLFLVYAARMRFWHDMVQVDTPFLAFALGALLFVAKDEVSNRDALVSGALAGLSCMTKQVGVPLALGLVVYSFVAIRHRALRFLLGLLLLVPIGLFLLLESRLWAWTYLVTEPLGTGSAPSRLAIDPVTTYAARSTVGVLAVLVMVAVPFFYAKSRRLTSLCATSAVLLGVAGYAGYCKAGASENSLLCFFGGATLCLAVMPGALDSTKLVRVLVGIAVSLAFWMAPVRTPSNTQVSMQFERNLDGIVRSYDGSAMTPGRPEATYRVTGRLYYHHSTLKGLVGYRPLVPFPEPLRRDIRRHRWRAVVSWQHGIERELRAAGYRPVRSLGKDPRIGVRVELYESGTRR